MPTSDPSWSNTSTCHPSIQGSQRLWPVLSRWKETRLALASLKLFLRGFFGGPGEPPTSQVTKEASNKRQSHQGFPGWKQTAHHWAQTKQLCQGSSKDSSASFALVGTSGMHPRSAAARSTMATVLSTVRFWEPFRLGDREWEGQVWEATAMGKPTHSSTSQLHRLFFLWWSGTFQTLFQSSQSQTGWPGKYQALDF